VCRVLELNRRQSGWPSRLKSTTPTTLQPADDVVGGSTAIPPAPPGTAAIVIGIGSSTPSTLTNSTTESPNVTNKLPLESKAKSLRCWVVLVFVARVLTTPDGLISKMELAVGSVTKRFPEASNASL